jgi:hypothetical protein
MARSTFPFRTSAVPHAASSADMTVMKPSIDLLSLLPQSGVPFSLSPLSLGQLPSPAPFRAACAAARIATGILNGEQLT